MKVHPMVDNIPFLVAVDEWSKETAKYKMFLEELKEFILKNSHYDDRADKAIYPDLVIDEIEQFQAEQKTETSNNNHDNAELHDCEICRKEFSYDALVSYTGMGVCECVCLNCYKKLTEQKQVSDEQRKTD